MSTTTSSLDALYKGRKGRVDLVDVPELGYLMVSGRGGPEGDEFAEAVQALYAVSYAAHFLAKKEHSVATKVRPLEALWWVDDPGQQAIVTAVAAGRTTMAGSDRRLWRWQAMMVQPDPIDEDTIRAAVERTRRRRVPAVDRLRFERWAEGRCAQVLHVGPYAAEASSIALLHEGICAAGCRPRGRHHEIYLGDPRRSAPEKLRTLLRQPVAPAE
ncbi:MAG TPA: GyrI-like domain-containing protein [Nocardioidaceae bacterium]|nr:GyrI-like domain-containing protein [Nocardioidaceae bacterium]